MKFTDAFYSRYYGSSLKTHFLTMECVASWIGVKVAVYHVTEKQKC